MVQRYSRRAKRSSASCVSRCFCKREAKAAYDAGAAVIHVHVRTDEGKPTQSKERFAE
ncbi:MAG: 3-keto-5-aminohexanoate cleavage protein, partial [Phascolarctobacterium sp.]|nr:3-keto-5-aminohexanoate cleavage protein [Phascolarctobacterium sp.]